MSTNAAKFIEESGGLFYISFRASDLYSKYVVSESVEQSLGWDASVLMRSMDLFRSLFHSDDIDKFESEVGRQVSNHSKNTKHITPIRMRNSDDLWRWHAVLMSVESSKTEDAIIHCAFSDIHAENERVLQLRESEERLELVLEGTRLGMWDWYPQTNDVRFNERWAEMLGYSLSEIEMNLNTWESKVHPDDLASCYADITAHMEGKVSFYENIHRMKHKDGSWRYILDRGKIVSRDAEGNPIRFTGTHTDITAQKEAEHRAVEASRAKGKFLAHMSHEIRTPLNGVLGMADVLADLNLTLEQLQTLRVLKESGTHLQSVLNDILDFSKIEEGALSFAAETFSLSTLVHKALGLFSERANDKNIDLELNIEPNVDDIRIGDTTRIRQVFFNLLSNALKFTDQGKVSVEISSRGDRVFATVRDTGIGIEDTSKLFVRFQQADSSVTKQYGGTGLGLAITQRLLQMMQGSIEVDSTPGEGSVFTIEMLLPVSEEVIAPRRADTELSEKAKAMRVLVAEDNPTNQLVIGKSLEFLGVTCEIVENGEYAVEAVTSKDFDLVFMDLHMPKMGGFEAASLIQSMKSDKGIQKPIVVALTADVMQETREECQKVGMNSILGKPFQRGQLIEMLNRIAGDG